MSERVSSTNADVPLSGSETEFAQASADDHQWSIKQIVSLLNAAGGTGSRFLWGHGVPDDANGNDNDIYLDMDTADLYGKENGTWF